MRRAVALIVMALALAVAGCGSTAHTPSARTARGASAGPAPAPPVHAGPPAAPVHAGLPAPPAHSPPSAPPVHSPPSAPSLRAHVRAQALLPQTSAEPSSASSEFKALMGALWSGIVAGSPARAAVAFFPRPAYVRLKDIAGAGADWGNRLFHTYALDVAAAHALLGAGAPSARLLAVDVPSSYAHWVEAGVCDNGIGYYEVPNARVVYRENGATRSFGIASMISWRGEWYVVHLGAVLRSGEAGTVDEPASGPGSAVYSGTC